ncbi:xylulokinase [Fodinicurvata sp. EGI_FJ10296]|uniref:xylulokinase n=1 Tax=Fodinicurvata sp. EGI_FJ10296 TaxID=3231908 RepID=UPI0034554D37
MYLGLDLGTSSVKAVVINADGQPLAQATAPVSVSRPKPGWSEHDPADWVSATDRVMSALAQDHGQLMGAVEAVGLSGQMHSATVMDASDRVLRPCMLWNDGRAQAECALLERLAPDLRTLTGNQAMAGFTAPKLLWMREHEPDLFRQVATVLLPKDYLRWHLSGEKASDMSDSAGTLWLDVGHRAWSPVLLDACGMSVSQMPRLVEGTEVSATLRADLAAKWGLRSGIPIAGGGGDNAAGAVGMGVVTPGTAFVSLGTSGVVFAVSDGFRPDPGKGLHAFCHALPDTWHQMTVVLSAAACVDWAARLVGFDDAGAFTTAADTAIPERCPIFLPYLTGERTPHSDSAARGVFFGLDPETGPAEIAYSVLEGVSFGLVDGVDVMRGAGTDPESFTVIGGGARSSVWGRIIAAAMARPMIYRSLGEVGPALGAARLAQIAATGSDPAMVATPPKEESRIEPDAAMTDRLAPRLERFRGLYTALKPSFDAAYG